MTLTGTDPVEYAKSLLAQGKAKEALAVTRPLADAPGASHAAITQHARTLKALRRTEEALRYNELAAERYEQSGVAWHNLAATLGDLGRGEQAAAAAERAFGIGLDAPETWSVYARALLAMGELERAAEAYRQALKRAPGNADTAIEYANLLWMRDGDLGAATAILDAAVQAGGPPGLLIMARGKLMEAAGHPLEAAQLLANMAQRLPDEVSLVLAAAQAALETGFDEAAEKFALAMLGRAPGRADVLNQLAIIQLARGRPDEALATARRGLHIEPNNQSLIGWAATAARVLGDPLHREVYDYSRMVRAYDIATPEGWRSLKAYLADLAAALRRMHPFQRHPFHQSLRHGSQTLQPLTGSLHPAVAAFFRAIEAPIREHMAALGEGSDPLRRRNTGEYVIQEAWSVLLQPGGFHKDHFHPQGWLSSAFYVETPGEALERGHEGWIRFGQPPVALNPPMDAEHWVKPKPGRLVLFPSYMWHGTEPFTTAERRMTIAFDVAPA